jgi:uncharacterized repeat protein (TIGR03806 family)
MLRELLRSRLPVVAPALLWVGLACSCANSPSTTKPSKATDAAAQTARDSSALTDSAAPDASDARTPAPADATAPADAGMTMAMDAALPLDAGPPAPPGKCEPPLSIDAPREKLSQTGCMDPDDPTKLAARVIPYEVNSPLWSDSADKTRGMVLPSGAKIHVVSCAKEPALCTQGAADDGKWVFPVGTVMVKSFVFDGKLVETRLFVHFDEQTWVGYSYEWDEAQTEATIVPDERRTRMFDTGKRTVEWSYPSRVDCMKCHNKAGGSTLGAQTAQMNRVLNGTNQIETLGALALFDAPVAKPYATPLVTPYTGQLGSPPQSATIEQRARSYMHANCAFCHRPDGDFTPLDLRYDIPLKQMNICNVAPQKGDVGVPTSTDLTPGKPMESVLWLRMNALPGNGRMPQIGTYHVDTDGVALIGDWITSIAACP